MLEHPYIDFDGDGHGDSYDTFSSPSGTQTFEHHDHHGHTDAVAWDYNRDGLVDAMMTDDNHDGALDQFHRDTNGDGIMDEAEPTNLDHGSSRHPYIDFNGDGKGDNYYQTTDGYADYYTHVDGHGHVDAKAVDGNEDGLIDELYVDRDHDGVLDHVLYDTTGDGIMDTSQKL
jgi:heat shock protein beta